LDLKSVDYTIHKNIFEDSELDIFLGDQDDDVIGRQLNSLIEDQLDGLQNFVDYFEKVKYPDGSKLVDKMINSRQEWWFTAPVESRYREYEAWKPFQSKLLNQVSLDYNIDVKNLDFSFSRIQIYTPDCFILPHSDKTYGAVNSNVCAVLIPLNSKPINAVGGDLLVGEIRDKNDGSPLELDTLLSTYESVKGDILTLDFNSDKLHQVTKVKNWARVMLTAFIKDKTLD
jgi:hypothetical protein